jgi:hypothetical protein
MSASQAGRRRFESARPLSILQQRLTAIFGGYIISPGIGEALKIAGAMVLTLAAFNPT